MWIMFTTMKEKYAFVVYKIKITFFKSCLDNLMLWYTSGSNVTTLP